MKKKSVTMLVEDSVGELDENESVAVPILTECDINDDFQDGMDKVGDKLPILTLRNMVLFPGVAMPVVIGRAKSMRLVDDVMKKKTLVGVVCQKDVNTEDPGKDEIYTVGVVAEIIRTLDMPDGTTTVILQGKKRFQLEEIVSSEPYLLGRIKLVGETLPAGEDKEFDVLVMTIKDLIIKLLKGMTDKPPRDFILSLKQNKNNNYVINFACTNVQTSAAEKQGLLEIESMKDRAFRLVFILNRESQLMDIKASIQLKTHEDINQQQKEYFLQQQIKTIQEELGGGNISDIEIDEFKAQGAKKKWSNEVAEIFYKELRKLERLNPQSPDYSVQNQYIQTMLSLPWNEYSKDNFNLKHAQQILDKDHYGLEKVKERIIEHLAVLKLKGDMKSPILCLYGPPGVGKTSLGRSIAKALNRKYIRVSLGGMHDEAEIRGHRRTYIGAMPGRVIKNLQKAGTSNPVFVLDEIDKISGDFKGDPSSALLEVLDPEQNSTFHDNYLDIDYDLSKVMFIATANNINNVAQPLLDRMELIDISGYILEEKVEIASRHLVPKQLDAHGLAKGQVKFPKKTLQLIIDSYTRESGVRELDKKIAKIVRKLARKYASDIELPAQVRADDVKEYLGSVEYTRDKYQGNEYAGVVTGLAWTAVGGEILFVESSLSKGKGSKLTLTGNLGDVMKESAMLAVEYIHAHASVFGIKEEMFENWNIHIHVPEGAIPKDGPSAGVTMVTSLVSALTQKKVRSNLAMTGEITLRGKVLPVGGIREKILAAKRAGITDILMCKDNKKDIEEIKPEYLKGLSFHYVDDICEVVKYAILDEKVKNPLF